MDRLNFFFPYEGAAAHYENQLTRALLVLLRYSPMAHNVWLRMVAPGLSLQTLPSAEFATQRQRVLEQGAIAPGAEGPIGISVWLAPDASQIKESVTPSDRIQVLDGIITYGDRLVVIVENKITFGQVTDQPHRINLHDVPVRWNAQPQAVDWQTLLTGFSDLIERSLVSGAEQLLITDFLDLVEVSFPFIGPYSSVARCADNEFRLNRRLDAVLGDAIYSGDSQKVGCRYLSGTNKIASAYLNFSSSESTVCLQMFPADTLNQSRALYGDPAAVEAVLALRSYKWSIEPNFHWGYMAKGLAWTKTPCSLEDYCSFWVNEIGTTGELPRSAWNIYWTRLEAAHIVEAAGRAKFDTDFTDSKRDKAQPRPGLACEFVWSLAEAEHLDSKEQFVEAVRTRLNQMLAALRAPLSRRAD
jgi:hypothetical protein